MQETTRVIQHHSRVFTLLNKLRNELAHAFVTPVKHRRVMVVADLPVIHHVFQIADDRRRPQISTAGGNQRLVHVQADTERAPDPAKTASRFRKIVRTRTVHRFGNPAFGSANIRKTFDDFG